MPLTEEQANRLFTNLDDVKTVVQEMVTATAVLTTEHQNIKPQISDLSKIQKEQGEMITSLRLAGAKWAAIAGLAGASVPTIIGIILWLLNRGGN